MSVTKVSSALLADDSVVAATIADDAVGTAAIADDAITAATIADDAVGTAAIADDAITAAAIADDAITAAAIADDAITAAAIADDAVGTAAIADNAITAAAITDGTITAAKLGTGVGGAFNNFLVKTANYTAVTRDQLVVNSGSAVTITLPASPSAGNIVFIENAGAGTVTVARNGSNINSTADDGELATGAGATLVYVDSTIGWKEL
jgi:hypothetical protein